MDMSINNNTIDSQPENIEESDLTVIRELDLWSDDSNEKSYIMELVPTDEVQYHTSFAIKILGYNCFRWITIMFLILFTMMILISVIYYFIEGTKHNYIILCYELNDKIYFPFIPNSYAFLLFLLIIVILLITVLNTLIRNDINYIYPFLNNSSFALPGSFIIISIQFTIGIFLLRSLTTLIVDIILGFISLCLIAMVYFPGKRKIYTKPIRIVNESILPSVLLCFTCYNFLYSTIDVITRTPHNLSLYTSLKMEMELTFNIIFFGIALIALTINKDIIFPLMLGIIEIGFLAKSKKNGQYEIIVSIFILLFLFVSVVITIFKFRVKVFGYMHNQDKVLIKYDKDVEYQLKDILI